MLICPLRYSLTRRYQAVSFYTAQRQRNRIRCNQIGTLSEAAEYLAKKGLTQQGAPAIVRLISQIAARFSVVVSEKVAAQAVPVVGALGGAAITTLFMNHYQDMGRGHFIVRRLERLHGQEQIRQLYASL